LRLPLRPGNFAPMFTAYVQAPPYVPKNKIRVVTAASLFDGHDSAINIPA
jgi:methylmalonyl-CoA mutase cobalamin-binding subunit